MREGDREKKAWKNIFETVEGLCDFENKRWKKREQMLRVVDRQQNFVRVNNPIEMHAL